MQRNIWLILAVIILLAIGGWFWSQRGAGPETPTIQGPSGQPSVLGPSGPPPAAAPARAITVAGDEFSFEPKEVRVRAGETITLTFQNKGRAPHTFTIPELDVDTGIVAAGSQSQLTFTAPDNNLTYQSICTVPGHKEAGMVGKLTVE